MKVRCNLQRGPTGLVCKIGRSYFFSSTVVARILLLAGFSIFLTELKAQKYSAEKGTVAFFSDAALEDIKAENTAIASLFNAGSGELAFVVKIRDFVFDKELMREHFNDKYMESEKFPKASFQGVLVGFNLGAVGLQKVRASGKLMIHGVTNTVDIAGTLEMVGGKPAMKSKFKIKLADYKIKIPKLVWQNIAEEVEVTLDFIYKPI